MEWNKNSKKSQEWIDKIAVMILVKQELARVDYLGTWPHHLPEIAATEEQLAAVESHLGYELNASYKDFLRCTNGWKGFYQTVNLFGTGDLMGSNLMNYARKMLYVLDDCGALKSLGFSKEELLPIAATIEDTDLFLMAHPASHQPGIVIWFAGEEIDRYPSFEEYFLAMADYSRLEIETINKEIEKGTYPY